MMTERELIALLYRADWTRLSLSGRDSESGRYAEGSDGERIWVWAQSPPGSPPGLPPGEMRIGGSPGSPFPALPCPS
jgi:hypothetical protein